MWMALREDVLLFSEQRVEDHLILGMYGNSLDRMPTFVRDAFHANTLGPIARDAIGRR